MEKWSKLKKIDYYYVFVLTIMILVTFIMTIKQMGEMYSDVAVHARWAGAGRVDNTYAKFASYPVWHMGVQLWANKLHLPLDFAAAVVNSGFAALTVTAVYGILKRNLKTNISSMLIAFLTIGLSFITTFYVPFINPNIYINFCGPTIWHNPTNMAVKSVAIISIYLFYILYKSIDRGYVRNKKWLMLMLSILLFISCIIKPSFLQGFLPAVMLFLLIELIMSKGKIFVFCVQSAIMCLPAAAYLLFQLLSVFSPEEERQMQIAYMEVIGGWSPYPWLSLFLMTVFPLFTIVIFNKKLFKDKLYILSGLFALVSLAEAIFLVEVNEPNSGNLCWAWQIAVFFLFLVSVIRFYQNITFKSSIKKERMVFVIGNCIFIWHAVSGMLYYGRLLLTDAWFK